MLNKKEENNKSISEKVLERLANSKEISITETFVPIDDDFTIHKCWAMDEPNEYIKYNHRTKLWTFYGIKKRLKDLNYCHKCGKSLVELETNIKAKIDKDNCKHDNIMIALWTGFQGQNKDGTFTKMLYEYICQYCSKVMFVDEYNNDYVIKTRPIDFV